MARTATFEWVNTSHPYKDFEPASGYETATGADGEVDHINGITRVTQVLDGSTPDYLSMLDGSERQVSRMDSERIIAGEPYSSTMAY